MKTLSFDLEKALNGAKVVTRDGREVPEVHHFKSVHGSYCVVAVINNKAETFTKTGRFLDGGTDGNDLFLLDESEQEFKIGDTVCYMGCEGRYEVISNYKNTDKLILERGDGFLTVARNNDPKLVKPESEKLSGFINVYKSRGSALINETKLEAERYSDDKRIACIDLSQFNVGHGLEK